MENGHTLQVKFDALTITRTYVSVNDTVYRTATKWTKSIYILAADLMLDGQSLDRKKRAALVYYWPTSTLISNRYATREQSQGRKQRRIPVK